MTTQTQTTNFVMPSDAYMLALAGREMVLTLEGVTSVLAFMRDAQANKNSPTSTALQMVINTLCENKSSLYEAIDKYQPSLTVDMYNEV